MPVKMMLSTVTGAFHAFDSAQKVNHSRNRQNQADYARVTAFNLQTLKERLGPLADHIEWAETDTGLGASNSDTGTDMRGGVYMGRGSSMQKPVEADGVRLHGRLERHTVHGTRTGRSRRPGTY